jgi:hypothetical protein
MSQSTGLPPTLDAGINPPSQNLTGMARTGSDPAWSLVAITPSDSTVYDPPLRAVYVGATGNVAVRAIGDASAVTFIGVPTGGYVLAQCSRVMATGTTATSLVGLR